MGYRDESTHPKMTFYLYPWLPVENNRLSSASMFKFENKDMYQLGFTVDKQLGDVCLHLSLTMVQ